MPRDERVPGGEVRVERDRTVEPTARDRGVAQTALDHDPVEELEGVAGAEAEGAPGVAECLDAAAVPLERPCADVVPTDRRTGALRVSGERTRASRCAAVVGVEER